MFYSQFILAKKGPLGTIWIAAHLERKLRKNQVADTDIGVSVDSILFPDVPIALRLSSHLLLGVVRIYNRKVNYLFDDCSEALLKVKQAFRSTAVDLPPDESKAPYHSITLPETFDLDDFELPDNDILQGNYVDHHISSREQITLQDPMEGVSYSTSKFGLDERFGDGDASGLDLDEELLLEKIDNAGQADESADPQASVRSMSPLKEDEHSEDNAADAETMVDGADTAFMDYDQAPRTPGLVEEPTLSNVQEASACDDHLESEYHLESTKKENQIDMSYDDKQEVDWYDAAGSAIPQGGLPWENGQQADVVLEIKELRTEEQSPVEANVETVALKEFPSISESFTDISIQLKDTNTASNSDNVIRVSDVPFTGGLQNGAISEDRMHFLSSNDISDDHQDPIGIGLEENPEISGVSTCQKVPEGVSAKDTSLLEVGVSDSVENASTEQKSCAEKIEFPPENHVGSFQENLEPQDCRETADASTENLGAHDKEVSTEIPFLRPCSSILELSEVTKPGSREVINADAPSDATAMASAGNLGKENCGTGTEQELKDNQVQQPVSGDVYHSMSSITDGQVDTSHPQNELTGNFNNYVDTELPAPEKVLSVFEGPADPSRDMLVEVSPAEFEGIYEGDSGSKTVVGKKRSFTGSTLTEQSMYSVESSRVVRFKRTTESVPDDDDLLSSILVGRRSSALKLKPTPPVSEVTSTKRSRSAPRSSAPKRKLLLDDTMVLHGDTIRQQLTSTEDIRRVRKKAPCTYPEISVMQKQHLEAEMFLDAVFTGLSTELTSLHSQVHDLSRISVCQNDTAGSSLEVAAEQRLASQNDQNDETLGGLKLASQQDDNSAAALETVSEPHFTSQNNESGDTHYIGSYKGSENTDEMGNGFKEVNTEVLPMIVSEMPDPSENNLPSKNVLQEVDYTDAEVNGSGEQIKPIIDAGPDDSMQETVPCVAGVDTSSLHSGALGPAVITEVDGHDASDTTADIFEKTGAPSVDLNSTIADDGQRIGRAEEATELAGDVNGEGETLHGERDDFLSDIAQFGSALEHMPNVEHGGLEYNVQNEMNNVTPEEHRIGEFMYSDNISMLQDHYMNNGEIPDHMEAYHPNLVDAEISDFGQQGRDVQELDYSATADDTEFLNVDDDELNEMADEDIPEAEETRFTENSGWSSRTRAVSKYLQTVFVKEAECGKKSLSMNRLLIGKSRKEASRMFFETLVLKTRDYIHVEQQNAFDDIAMKPRGKLIKFDF